VWSYRTRLGRIGDSQKAPIKIGAEQRMKESYCEGVASHTGPESCLDLPRGGGEALTGEDTGGLLSSEITIIRRPSWLTGAKATRGTAISERCPAPAESKNLACAYVPQAGIGRPRRGGCMEKKET